MSTIEATHLVAIDFLLSSLCSSEVYISDDEEDKEVGEGDGDVSAALGEQQQGIIDHG